ncbi:hypothetical protein BCR37DRAFT_383111, partial [Protomyces lactucae-debilis]
HRLGSSSSSLLSVDFRFALLWAHNQGNPMSMSSFQDRESLFQLVNDRLDLLNNLVCFHQVTCMCRDVVPCGVAQWRLWPECRCES